MKNIPDTVLLLIAGLIDSQHAIITSLIVSKAIDRAVIEYALEASLANYSEGSPESTACTLLLRRLRPLPHPPEKIEKSRPAWLRVIEGGMQRDRP